MDFSARNTLHEHGIVDLVVKRADMRDTLARIVGLLRQRTPLSDAA